MHAQGRDEVARALEGDEGAWRAIVDAVGPPVLGYARAKGRADAEDVLADVLLALTKSLERFEGDIVALRAFALKIARDRVADRFRRGSGKYEEPTDSIPDRGAGDDIAEAVSDSAFVAQALRLLPEAQREAVYLRIVCDLSAEEVGRIIGKRPGAVRVMVHRALVRLRETLTEGVVTP